MVPNCEKWVTLKTYSTCNRQYWPYSSPVVVIHQKDESSRLCCDYWKHIQLYFSMNTRPNWQSCREPIFQSLRSRKSKVYSIYYTLGVQIDPYSTWVDESLYMLPTDYEAFLGDIRNDFTLTCLDDLLIYSATFDDHL